MIAEPVFVKTGKHTYFQKKRKDLLLNKKDFRAESNCSEESGKERVFLKKCTW